MKQCNEWTKEIIANVTDHSFMQEIQRPWSTNDWDVGVQSIKHFTGLNRVNEMTLRIPEDTILNEKNEISTCVFLYEQSVPSKWLGQKVFMKPLGGEMETRGVGVLPSVDVGRRSELSKNVVIDVLVINLSDEPTPFRRGAPVGEAMRVGELPPEG